jgi:hypothetical protein
MKRLKNFIFLFAVHPEKYSCFKKINTNHEVGHIFHRMRKAIHIRVNG